MATTEYEIDDNVKNIQELSNVDGKFFSPIELDVSKCIPIELPPLEWVNYNSVPEKLGVTNTGTTAILSAKWKDNWPHIRGGPLVGNYVFSQIHFHWGDNDCVGSEHVADQEKFPMEMHVVHHKWIYKSQLKSHLQPDGLLVVAYMFRIVDELNPDIEPIVEAVKRAKAPSQFSLLSKLRPIQDFIHKFDSDYLVYWGAIDANNDIHRILWCITRVPIGISAEQIAAFRNMKNSENKPIVNNFRHLNALGARSVFLVNSKNVDHPTIYSKVFTSVRVLSPPVKSLASSFHESEFITPVVNLDEVSDRTVLDNVYHLNKTAQFPPTVVKTETEQISTCKPNAERHRLQINHDNILKPQTQYIEDNTMKSPEILNEISKDLIEVKRQGSCKTVEIIQRKTPKKTIICIPSENLDVKSSPEPFFKGVSYNVAVLKTDADDKQDNMFNEIATEAVNKKDDTKTVNESATKAVNERWPFVDKEFEATVRSPIHIESQNVRHFALPPLLLQWNLKGDSEYFTLSNTGRTVRMVTTDNKEIAFTLKGGPCKYPYLFQEVHFHWEAEHVIDGIRYPLEAHFVFFKEGCQSMEEALNTVGGISVVGLLFHEDKENNENLKTFLQYFKYIQRPYTSVKVPTSAIYWFRDKTPMSNYYAYPGSLTTSAHVARDIVTWIIYSSTIPISADQLKKFKTLEEGGHFIESNYANLHPLKNRPLIYCATPKK